ncbi:MAG TPA: hypothetical protein VK673_17695 [Chthoniobacterales bacterium]|nr:hypothetical protein [Chthoniobacterales bacterium]
MRRRQYDAARTQAPQACDRPEQETLTDSSGASRRIAGALLEPYFKSAVQITADQIDPAMDSGRLVQGALRVPIAGSMTLFVAGTRQVKIRQASVGFLSIAPKFI